MTIEQASRRRLWATVAAFMLIGSVGCGAQLDGSQGQLDPGEVRDSVEVEVYEQAPRITELGAGIHRPESSRGGDLIVAATAGVQLGGDVANLLVQQPVDHRVHIFVGGQGLSSRRELLPDCGEPAL